MTAVTADTAFFSGRTESSRSKMIASASLASALAIFFSLSAGTNNQLRGWLMQASGGGGRIVSSCTPSRHAG